MTWANDKNWKMAVEVQNLFDTYYLLTVFDQTIGGQGYATGQPGRPREWSISLTKRF